MEKTKFRTITVFADIVILTISFLIMASSKPAGLKAYVPSHSIFFSILVLLWIVVSLINGKMHRGKIINFSTVFNRVMSSNIISLAITALIMYIFRDYAYSRTVVLGTAIVATFLELMLGSVFIAYKKAPVQDYEDYFKYQKQRRPSEYELVSDLNGNGKSTVINPLVNPGT